MFRRSRIVLAGVVLVALTTPRFVHAQQRDAQTRGMIRQAMEDYQNLDIDGALSRLRLALNGCGRNQCSPAMVARLHIAIGVVTVGGQNDTAAGTTSFEAALRLDPTAEPDALLVTPEITSAINAARQRVGGAATPSGPPAGRGTPAGPGPGTPATPVLPAGPVAAMAHTPFSEQLENTPLPVFTEIGAVQASTVVVHYRGLGMSGYSHLPMERIANGYGVVIPCGQVIAPHVEYYVTASNEGNTVVGQAGSPEQPYRVSVVRTRSQPPAALPGRMPPEQCGEDCPPGMSGPQCHSGSSSNGRGMRQMGDPCETDTQCATGMHCGGGSCTAGEATSSAQSGFYRFGVDVGIGGGFGYLTGTPQYSEYRDYNADDAFPATCGPPRADADPNMPDTAGTLACPGRISNQPLSPGFSPSAYFYGAIRVNITNRIGIGASVRFAFDSSGTGTLPNLFFGLRGYYAFTNGGFTRNGLVGAAFLGSGVGQMQVRPPIACSMPPNCIAGAHVISGLNNVHGGVRVEYGFASIMHVGAELTLQFQVPNFLFVADLHALVGLHF